MSVRSKAILPVLAAVLLAGPSALADVKILGQPGSYPTFQAAIDAAQDGDVLLVEPGIYAGNFTIDDKALTLLAESGWVRLNGTGIVRNLSPDRIVSISGIEILAPAHSGSTAMTLENNQGHVRLQKCSFIGRSGSQGGLPSAGAGLRVIDSSRVFISHTHSFGGSWGAVAGKAGGLAGGDGLHATQSVVVIHESVVGGGRGLDEGIPTGGDGGAGLRFEGLGLLVSGSTLAGGHGGSGDFIGCFDGGRGGDALILHVGDFRRHDTVLTPGNGGPNVCGGWAPPGSAIQLLGGSVAEIFGDARTLTGPDLTTDNATTLYTVQGTPGDTVWFLQARHPGFHFLPALKGVGGLSYPWGLSLQPAGTIGASGSMTVELILGDLIGPQAGWIGYLQAMFLDPVGERFLSNPLTVLIENT